MEKKKKNTLGGVAYAFGIFQIVTGVMLMGEKHQVELAKQANEQNDPKAEEEHQKLAFLFSRGADYLAMLWDACDKIGKEMSPENDTTGNSLKQENGTTGEQSGAKNGTTGEISDVEKNNNAGKKPQQKRRKHHDRPRKRITVEREGFR